VENHANVLGRRKRPHYYHFNNIFIAAKLLQHKRRKFLWSVGTERYRSAQALLDAGAIQILWVGVIALKEHSYNARNQLIRIAGL